MQAMVASLQEAQEMEQHIQNLDEALKANKLKRLQVPGQGDCQYLFLIASAKKQGMDFGRPADVRIKVFQALLASQGRYMQYWDESWGSYEEWARKRLVSGTWRDDCYTSGGSVPFRFSRLVGFVHLTS